MAQTQLPVGVQTGPGLGGLEKITIEHASASAELYLHGAHVTAWAPRGTRPVLWVSPLSPFAPGKAIRGGVPICFPWFGARAGDASAPMHGLARLVPWRLESAERSARSTTIDLALRSSDVPAHGLHWSARYRVEVSESLSLTLDVENVGEMPLTYEEALHTYYAVADARQATVTGLAGTTYLDKPSGLTRRVQDDGAIRFGEEVDRIYLATRAECAVEDPVWRRRIRVAKQHSETTVVWNPGPVRGAAMPEVREGWTGFVCVETCNVNAHSITLAPGARHSISARIAVEAV
jgi:D-hexose-6-phosphate mutarotase